MASVGSLMVFLRADTTRFTYNMARAQRSVRKTERVVESSASRITHAIRQIGTAVATYFAIRAVSEFGRSFVDLLQQVEGVETAFGAIADSTEEVNNQFNFLRDLSNALNTDFFELQQNYKSLWAASRSLGIANKDVQLTFQGIIASATALGITGDDLRLAMRAVTQIFQKGKVQAEELRGQLGERLPTAMSTLAKVLGVTTPELDKLLEQGQLTAESVIHMAAAMGDEFGPAAIEARDKTARLMDKLREARKRFMLAFGDAGLSGVVKGAIVALTRLFQWAAANIGNWINSIRGFFQALYDMIDQNRTVVVGFAAALTTVLIPAFFGLTGAIVRATAAVVAFTASLLTNPLFLVAAAVGAATAALYKFWDATVDVGDATVSVGGVVVGIWNTITRLLETLGQVVRDVIEYFDSLGRVIMSVFSFDWDGVKDAWKDLGEAGEGIGDNFLENVKRINEAFQGILIDAEKNTETAKEWKQSVDNLIDAFVNLPETIRQKIKISVEGFELPVQGEPEAGLGLLGMDGDAEDKLKEELEDAAKVWREFQESLGSEFMQRRRQIIREFSEIAAAARKLGYDVSGVYRAMNQRLAELEEERKEHAKEQWMEQLENSRNAIDGMQRAFISYVDEATDRAAQFEELTTKAFRGIEDVFVEFVESGKLNWSDMIDSMISDLIRLTIRTQVLGRIMQGLGEMGGLFGGFSTGGTGTGLFGFLGGMFRQRGGPVKAGQPYIVGEKRPELFVPDTPGHVYPRVPNMSGATSKPVSVEIINESGVPMQGRAQVTEDNQRMLMRIWMSGVQQNVEGSRDFLFQGGG
jgi:tape measure domain-containing protein